MASADRVRAGLPPLARRELLEGDTVGVDVRSTSARAERTVRWPPRVRAPSVYLRSRGENPVGLARHRANLGLPPLARRELYSLLSPNRRGRSTSARAERTKGRGRRRRLPPVYLRSRGENTMKATKRSPVGGLPPLARRELRGRRAHWLATWSTSARAERTKPSRWPAPWRRVYLRSRGENRTRARDASPRRGLPPLARREPVVARVEGVIRRSTSARAERTRHRSHVSPPIGVYLRSRGENARPAAGLPDEQGLPPLARRERRTLANCWRRARSTSARAERTPTPPRPAISPAVYLRSRGENRRNRLPDRAQDRSTSARAERTAPAPHRRRLAGVYLRSRGENRRVALLSGSSSGLPPLARRELQVARERAVSDGSTSARAERTLPLIPQRDKHLWRW